MSKKAKAPKKIGERIYEIGYHVVSSVAEEGIPAEVEKVKTILNKENAVIISEEAPKLRVLAYPIKKAFGGQYKTFDKAYFGWVKFELGENGDVKNIDSALKASETILRYILIKTIRENTMYYPKISVYSESKENRVKPSVLKEEKVVKTASIEEIDKSIDDLVEDNKIVI